MRDFFTFYKDIQSIDFPFQAFSFYHFILVFLSFLVIYLFLRVYNTQSFYRQRKIQIGMAIYFLVEEAVYTVWLLLMCHESVWLEILPLELCSICVYINVLSVFTGRKTMRFFSAIVGFAAGSVAILYPANISGLYPVLSYRTINFYVLHASFIIFACIQLKDTTLLNFRNVTPNFLILSGLFTIAFTVNCIMHTQYMFVGTPPSIGFIGSLYHLTGFVFFLPVILSILYILQVFVFFVLRMIVFKCKKLSHDTQIA